MRPSGGFLLAALLCAGCASTELVDTANDAETTVSYDWRDLEGAAASLDQVDPEQLSDNARSIYNQIYGNVHADEIQALFDAGAAAYDAQNYEEAAASLQRVVDFDERYSDGYALYYLARSYENLGQNAEALDLFQRFAEGYPGTQRASYANGAIARLQPLVDQAQGEEQSGAADVQDQTQPDGQDGAAAQ